MSEAPSLSSVASTLRVLLVEDQPLDAELNLAALARAGFQPTSVCVDNEADFRRALQDRPDLILSDFSLPKFDGITALRIRNESGLDIPFIIISGTIGEDLAVAAMRLGAADYLLKDRLTRLGSAARAALDQARLRREQRQAEAALRESEARFRQIVERLEPVVWMTDADGTPLYTSPQLEQIWGISPTRHAADPRLWLEAVHPDDRSEVERAVRDERKRADHTLTYRITRPDGTVRWICDRAFMVRDQAGQIVRIVGTATDITVQRETEEQLFRAQRLEAIGTLSSGIAHDLNNILAPTLMVTAMLREHLEDGRDTELVDIIEQGARRGAHIIQQLLTFTRGSSTHPALIQPRELVEEMAGMMRETFPRAIEIVVALPDELDRVQADATQIHQVLMNLCVNARDAMPNGGRLTLAAECRDIGPREAGAHAAAKPGPHVVLSVSDTGPGIPAGIIDRVFEPFFTTKPVGEGTGLGLSTVAGIVRSHGGFITVTSPPAGGTRFQVHLPATPSVDREVPAAPSEPSAGGRGEVILLVDDERSIRFVAQRTLEKHDYRVIAAADGQEALGLFLEYGSRVDLVITDLMMPKMGGVALIKALRKFNPELKVLATTGLDGRVDQAELAKVGVTEILPKPFAPEALLGAVQRQLPRARPVGGPG